MHLQMQAGYESSITSLHFPFLAINKSQNLLLCKFVFHAPLFACRRLHLHRSRKYLSYPQTTCFWASRGKIVRVPFCSLSCTEENGRKSLMRQTQTMHSVVSVYHSLWLVCSHCPSNWGAMTGLATTLYNSQPRHSSSSQPQNFITTHSSSQNLIDTRPHHHTDSLLSQS